MPIRNGRPLAGQLTLERNGFAFVDHETRVADFLDVERLPAAYYPEIEGSWRARPVLTPSRSGRCLRVTRDPRGQPARD